MPVHKLMTPETNGKGLKFQGHIQYLGAQKVRLGSIADTIFNTVTVDTEKAMTPEESLGLSATLGLGERFDLYVNDSTDTAMMFGGKFQVLGNGFENRTEKDFLLAIAAGIGNSAADEGRIVTNDNKTYTSELELFSYEYMLSFGYRLDKKHMFYSTIFHTVYNVEAALKQNGIAISNGQIDGNSEISAFNLGAKVNNEKGDLYGQLEVGYAYGKYESDMDKHTTSYALNIGIIH